MSDRIKVVFIAGSGRSGSTLLGNLLGQIDGWADVGEIHHIWDRKIIENQICGCGQRIHDCAFWKPIIRDISENPDFPDPSRMVRLRATLFRSRNLLLPSSPRFIRRDSKALDEYLASLARLYRSIRDASGATVIVDSSKIPIHAYLLGLIDEIDAHIVHLVRDPRAVAYSWSVRKKKQRTAKGKPQTLKMRLLKTTLIWTAWNYIIGKRTRAGANSYQLVRYEDFVGDPEGTIRRIHHSVDERGVELPRVIDGYVNLAPTHTISGNPGRHDSGRTAIHVDNEWRRQLPVWGKILVSCLSIKGLIDYKYDFICRNKKKA